MVLNYWASWCGPCRAELPEFEQVQQELGDVVILAWNIEDNGWSSSFAQHNLPGLTFPLLRMQGKNPFPYTIVQGSTSYNFSEGKSSRNTSRNMKQFSYGETRYVPMTFIIDKEQVVREVHVGSMNSQGLETIVKRYR